MLAGDDDLAFVCAGLEKADEPTPARGSFIRVRAQDGERIGVARGD